MKRRRRRNEHESMLAGRRVHVKFSDGGGRVHMKVCLRRLRRWSVHEGTLVGEGGGVHVKVC